MRIRGFPDEESSLIVGNRHFLKILETGHIIKIFSNANNTIISKASNIMLEK